MTDRTIVARSLSVRPFSTITTILTVAVAVGLLLTLLTMRKSTQRAFERGAGDMHLLVTADSSPLASVLNAVFYANPPRRFLTWERYEKLRTEAPWAYAVPTIQGDSYRGFPVCATTRDYFMLHKPGPGEDWKLRGGRVFEEDFEIVLGDRVARAAGLRVGSKIVLSHGFPSAAQVQAAEAKAHADQDHDHEHGHDHAHDEEHADHAAHVHDEFVCTVVGILGPTGGVHDRVVYTTIATSWVMHAHDRRLRENPRTEKTTVNELLPEDRKITGVYLRLVTPEGSSSPANLPMVFDKFRRDTTLQVAGPSQEIGNLFKIVDNANRVFLVMAVLVLLAGAASVMLAVYHSMVQRRRQIAVMRVLGASKGRIFRLTLLESALLGLLGAIAGVAVAVIGTRLASGIIRERVRVVLEPDISWQTLLAVLLGTVLLACVAGLAPAFMAYRTSVGQNLRVAA
jgi:putative ABC transport system permease protein